MPERGPAVARKCNIAVYMFVTQKQRFSMARFMLAKTVRFMLAKPSQIVLSPYLWIHHPKNREGGSEVPPTLVPLGPSLPGP